MKNNFFKIYLLTFLLLSDFIMFAQGPGDEDGDGDLEGGDPSAPINGKILWLAIAAILFAFYTFSKKRKTA